jgi:hypothetical protein
MRQASGGDGRFAPTPGGCSLDAVRGYHATLTTLMLKESDFSSLLLRPRPQGASARDPMKVLEMTETFGHGLLHTHATTHYRRSPWPQ